MFFGLSTCFSIQFFGFLFILQQLFQIRNGFGYRDSIEDEAEVAADDYRISVTERDKEDTNLACIPIQKNA